MVPQRPDRCWARYAPPPVEAAAVPRLLLFPEPAVGALEGVVQRLLQSFLNLVPVRLHLDHIQTTLAAEMSGQPYRGPSSGDAEVRSSHNKSPGSGSGAGQQGAPSSSMISADTPPPSPAGSSERGSKACCFCWCCCCSCSCLTVKNGEELKNQSKDTKLENLNEKEENSVAQVEPTLEEIHTWSESFDRLMGSISGKRLFREFLRSEYSEENMLFYLACEDLKKEQNPELVEEKARLIYEDYISILSPKEVSLDSRVREVINRNMLDPTPRTFDEAQLQIYTLMHRDSYPRFLNSQTYKRLLQ